MPDGCVDEIPEREGMTELVSAMYYLPLARLVEAVFEDEAPRRTSLDLR